MDIEGVIQIDAEQAATVAEVIERAEAAGATHVLAVHETEPLALLSTDELRGEPAVGFRARVAAAPTPEEHAFGEVPGYVLPDPAVDIIRFGARMYVRAAVISRRWGAHTMAFLADPKLPGRPQPDPDPPVMYACPNGHYTVQPASDPNRTCPEPGCHLALERT